MRKLNLLIIFLAIATFCFGQNKYSFSIEQVSPLGSNRNKYIYKDYKLSVFQNSKSLQSIVLTEKQKQNLDSIITRIENEHLKDKYERTSITIIVDGISKKIGLLISDGVYW